ncbi:MAG: twin-arginine translocase subunit TatC [Bacteroidota bacterium]
MPLDQIDVDQLPSGDEEAEMSFLEHLEVLRWHIIRSLVAIVVVAVIVFIAKDVVFDYIIFAPKYEWFLPYQAMCGLSELIGMGQKMCISPPDFDVIATVFGERFIVHIKVSVTLGIIVAFPYIFYEFWKFIRPGLYEAEQKAARGIVGICSALFILGVLFGYFVISPFAVSFLAGYEIADVRSTTSLSSFVTYMTMFTLPAGLIFELPVVVYLFSKLGIIGPEFLRTYRKHAFVLILALSAVITPPDIVTQFLISIPLYVLYEISIRISKRVAKQRAAELA